MKTKLFDSTVIREAQDVMDFMANVLEASTEYSIVGKDLDGRILLWNEGARRIYGYEPEEVVGKANSSILHTPEDVKAGKHRDIMDIALRDGKWEGTLGHIRKNGKHFTVRVVITPRRDANGKSIGFVLISKDISKELRFSEELRKTKQFGSAIGGNAQEAAVAASEKRFRALIENAPDLIMVQALDGTITYRSPSVLRILGYRTDELLGAKGVDLLHPEDAARVSDAFARGLTRIGMIVPIEFRLRHRDGSWHEFEGIGTSVENEAGQIQGLMNARDITDRKRAQQAYAGSQRRFQALVEHAPDGIALLGLDGKLRQVTPSTQQILGYTLEDAVGQDPALLTHPDDLPALLGLLGDLIQNPGKVVSTEYRFRHKDGSWRWLESTISNLIAEPSVQALVFNYRDITESKRAEQALRESESRYCSLLDRILHGFALHEIICDESGQPIDYRFLEINPAFEALTGLRANEVVGRTVLEILPGTEPSWIETYGRVALTGQSIQFQNHSKELSKDYEVIAYCPKPGQFAVLFSDVTEHKQAEQEIESLANFPRENTAPTLRFARDGRLLYANPASAGLLRLWDCDIGDQPPDEIQLLIHQSLVMRASQEIEVAHENRLDALIFVPIVDNDYVNVYGSDITDRKQAEEQSRENEQKFSTLFRKAPYAVQLARLPDGVIIDVNEEFENLLGYSRQEAVGRTSVELNLYPDPGFRSRSKAEVDARGSTRNVETMLRTKSGDLRSVLVSTEILEVAGTKYLLVTGQDITKRKQVEAEIVTLAKFPSENPNPVLRMSNDGILLYANASSQPLLTLWKSAVNSKLPGHIQELVSKVLQAGQPKEVEIECESRVFSFVFVPIAEAGYVNGYGRDMTERRQAEARIHYQATLLANVNDAIVASDMNGRISNWNAAATEIYGWLVDEVLGQSVNAILQTEYEAGTSPEQVWQKFLKEGAWRGEVTQKRKDGTSISILAAVSLVRDQSGTPTAMVTVNRDITERKQAEAALRIENERFSRFVESNIVGIVIADASGQVITANDYYLKLLGLTRQDFLDGKVDWRKFTPPEWLPTDEKAIQELRENGVCKPYEKEYERADGTRVPVYIADAMLPGPEEQIAAFVLDITERKQAEAQIKDLLAFNEKVINHSPVGILIYKLSGECIVANENAATIIGAGVEKLKAQNFRTIESWKKSGLYDLVEQAITSKSPATADVHLFSTFGKDLWLTACMVIFQAKEEHHVLLTFSDITERKRAEERIQRHIQRLNALRTIDVAISSSFDIRVTLDIVLQQVLSESGVDAVAILLYDPDRQTMQYAASRGFRSKALHQAQLKLGEGYASRAVLERKTIHIQGLLEPGTILAEVMQSANDEFLDYYCMPLIVKDRVNGVLEVYHRSLLDPDPESLDFLETLAGQAAIALDNAQLFENLQRANAGLERRVAERTAELNQTNTELERANRSKDEFLANMSHELRTPLNVILGLSEVLLEYRRGPLTEPQEKALHMISSSGQHLLGLINDILDVSKVEAGKLQIHPDVISVKEVCESSLNFVRELALKKSISLEYHHRAEMKSVYADPQRLKQILVNLVNNAVKFTPEKGHVSLEVDVNEARDQIQFIVTDTGIGISPEDLQKLFTPFTQLDSSLSRQHDGTGLGLVLVYKFTELHGGSVHVESKVGTGSRFTIALPWIETPSTRPDPAEAVSVPVKMEQERSTSPAQASGLVLLVEDNESNILIMSDYLQEWGFQVALAHNGLEALDQAERLSPILILMDIQMPEMDGVQAMRRLRAIPRFATTPIIALTALAMPGDRERCLEAGANEYMSKPVSLKTLLKTIRALLTQGK